MSTLRSHDLEIDLEARTVRRAGHEIVLSPQEFALLALLARQPGRTLSPTLVWENLMGDLTRVRPRRLAPLVHTLRRKVDLGFTPPLILTYPGRGYLLRVEGA